MKRISYLLLPLLLLSALAPFAPFTLAAGAVTGAAFTTVNVAVDGPGHCLNGNPAVNCNIYNGKPYVWLNGGPKANKLGPSGRYFFAVLAPGGQPNANDRSPKNLSDDYDAYTNRTFTVTNGKVSAYTGTHTFNSLKIRLFPYANTPNPGGVYILAICSLSNGYPVKASLCKFDQFKVMRALPPTNTPTPTLPPPPPPPVCADFTKAPNPGDSVQVPGLVAADLQIQALAPDTAVRIKQGVAPYAYGANGGGVVNSVHNGGLGPKDGFSVWPPKDGTVPTLTFTWENVKVTYFQLHMLDFGDLNPTLQADHLVTMTAYNSSHVQVDQQTLEYTTPAMKFPNSSNIYGDLQINGDALQAPDGKPGNWTWKVSGTGITSVELVFGAGADPNIGFDNLCFKVQP